MRSHLASLAAAALLAGTALAAQAATLVEVYKSPTCDCCGRWIEHLQKSGFKVATHDVDNLQGERRRLGIPDRYASCHSARVGDYVLEGHVPAADIQRLLKEKPKARGIAVPAMPTGAPGMDIPNSPPYATVLIQADGSSRVYAQH